MQTSVTHTLNAAAGRARVQDRSGVTCDVVRFRKGQLRETEANLAAEEPLEIRLCHRRAEARQIKSLSVTIRTPGNDCELAVGFLVTVAVMVVAIGAQSSLAVQVAKQLAITLAGFLRDCQFNIYNRPERVCFTEQARRQ